MVPRMKPIGGNRVANPVVFPAGGTNTNYVAAVTAAANSLVSQRFLLPEDVATYVTPATLMVIPANP